LFLHAGTVAFLGKARFLLAGDPVSLQGAEDRHNTAVNAQAIPQLREDGVGLLADQSKQASNCLGVEFWNGATTMGFGLDRSGASITLQESNDCRRIDSEHFRQLANRMFTHLDPSNNTRSEIY
jgi:hypothetical protein